ncbi:Plasmodium vivax Vir protein, putative [Plasmodium vivax]|uniref:Vir protein, putative n=1 Tax=Plasmodium vivax TaxID=5855 RepID=A0A1G4HDV4_PLAVI|nr:Plasmodium vivax Vir protein, putative [Plasmodium vivax]
MTEITVDIGKWKKEYPFLENVWDIYDKFFETINEREYTSTLSFCDIEDMFIKDNKGVHRQICKKLARNLLSLADSGYGAHELLKRCNILYIWLYLEIKKNELSDDTVKFIFDGLNKIINMMHKEAPCPYFSFKENLHKPEDLMELRIFNDNIVTVQNILLEESYNDSYCSCQKYVNYCFNKYKSLKNEYCIQDKDKVTNNINTCNELTKFESLYSFLTDKPNIRDKIPNINSSSNTTINIERCKSYAVKETSTTIIDDQSGSTTQRSVNTAIGTMAGFTPARRLLHSGLRRDIGRIKNTMYSEDANALTFDRLEHSDYNSYNIGYEAT